VKLRIYFGGRVVRLTQLHLDQKRHREQSSVSDGEWQKFLLRQRKHKGQVVRSYY